MTVERRHLLRNGLSLGALTLLTGCDLSDFDAVQRVLAEFSAWNDRVQAALVQRHAAWRRPSPRRWRSRTSATTPGTDRKSAPDLKPEDYRLMLSGLIANKRPWTVEQLYALPQVSQVTRHVCVEGWSMIGKWTGAPLKYVPGTRRRRHHREICRVRMRRRLL